MLSGIIIIDKPEGFTSHDVVGKLRGILHERRIGHGGTLDPMATGVLPVFVGRATRAAEYCERSEKEYIAGLRLGIVTDTQDTTGNILQEKTADISEEKLKNTLSGFIGHQMQIPPMYSAVKINGKKLYELARQGTEVERKPREIEIKKLEYMGKDENGDAVLDIVCSKGTYIRTLCNDIGEKLGCGGAMSSLRRVKAAGYCEAEAISLDEVAELFGMGQTDRFLRPVDSMFSKYESDTVPDEHAEKQVRNGGGYKSDRPAGKYRVYGKNGEFLMLGVCDGSFMRTEKSFFEVV